MERIKKLNIKPYLIISIIYFSAHMFLLFLSGCWWDDWTFMSHDLVYINQVASQSGRPEWNLLIPLCWSLANNGRILIFLLYYLDSLFLFSALKNCHFFTEQQSLLITLLFIVIPVNDARLLISNFPYAVGLFFFFLALLLFIKWNNSSKQIFKRLIVLLLFFVSFILNSLLAFYYVIFVYLFIVDYLDNNEDKLYRRIIISIKNILIQYPDFFLLPFVYFIGNKLLFPVTEGAFVSRSSVTVSGLLKCIKYIPLSMISIMSNILKQFFACLNYWPIICMCLILVVMVFMRGSDKEDNNKKTVIYFTLFGVVSLMLGIFAYVEIRGGIISSTGVKGRDAILVPFGVSIIIYSLLNIFNNKTRHILYTLLIVLGICSMNLLYLEWQKDYYYQLSMEVLLDNKVVKDNDTFFLADLNESKIEGERFYSINVLADHIYNDETRLFIPKVSNLYMLSSKAQIEYVKQTLNGSYMMKNYNPEDYNFDAVLIFDCILDNKEVLEMKYYELFKRDIFEKMIEDNGSMKIVEVDDDFTRKLFMENDNGNIKDDFDVLELLESGY